VASPSSSCAPQRGHGARARSAGTTTSRPQRGQVAWASTARDGSAACQAPHDRQRTASRPGGSATGSPQAAHGRSGASTKRTASPHDGHVPRSPRAASSVPHAGQGVVATGLAPAGLAALRGTRRQSTPCP